MATLAHLASQPAHATERKAAAASGPTALTHATPAPAKPTASVASGISLRVIGSTTQIRLRCTHPPAVRATVIADPYRLVIDASDLDFKLPRGSGRTGGGSVTSYRYGLFAPGQSRMVLDLNGPVRISRAQIEVQQGTRHSELVIDLEPVTESEFAALNPPTPQPAPPGPATASTAPSARPHDNRGSAPAPTAAAGSTAHPVPRLRDGRYDAAPAPAPARRPVIVIDPGHGGLDPGAVGSRGVAEKDVVLAVARRLQAKLAASGRYDVAMTRAADTFISLDDRVALAERVEADLFISLHADAVGNAAVAGAIRGATVYTLSSRASDEQARRLADRENAADVLAGLQGQSAEASDDVRTILIDLMRRETADFSTRARDAVVARLRGRIALARTPKRAAAFRVLKQAQTPAVLVELGYMTNAADQALMTTIDWQAKVAKGLQEAVDAFFQATGQTARP